MRKEWKWKFFLGICTGFRFCKLYNGKGMEVEMLLSYLYRFFILFKTESLYLYEKGMEVEMLLTFLYMFSYNCIRRTIQIIRCYVQNSNCRLTLFAYNVRYLFKGGGRHKIKGNKTPWNLV